MTSPAHEVPTHLMVEDKVLLGLTVRQCLYLLVGCSISYGAWGQLSATSEILQVGITAALAVLGCAFALLKPAGRPLEEWLAAGLLFCASPRQASWTIHEPRAEDWRPASGLWQQLSPQAVWASDVANADDADEDPDFDEAYA